MSSAGSTSLSGNDEVFACATSTRAINTFFQKKGFSPNFWTYNASLGVAYDKDGSRLVLQSNQHNEVYFVSDRGEISSFQKPKPGLFFFRGGDVPAVVLYGAGERKLGIAGRATILMGPNEFSVCVDRNNSYFARMFRIGVNVGDRYVVFDSEDMKEQFSDSGFALSIESRKDAISVVTYAPIGDGFQLSTYTKGNLWHLDDRVDIPAPGALKHGWHFSYSDSDLSRSIMMFLEYSIGGLRRNKIWIYSLVSKKYILETEIPRSTGNSYGILLPKGFADAPYILWAKKL